jgi:hypothetical protein
MSSRNRFYQSNKFIGPRRGYVYKTGPKGLGYYSNTVELKKMNEPVLTTTHKRKKQETNGPLHGPSLNTINGIIPYNPYNEGNIFLQRFKEGYKGEAFSRSTGARIDYRAGLMLSRLYIGSPKPIFDVEILTDKHHPPIEMGETIPAEYYDNYCSTPINTDVFLNNTDKYNDEFVCVIDSDNEHRLYHQISKVGKKLSLNKELKQAAESKELSDRPIVFIITQNAPHAMIYIIHNNKLYSVGYGYAGSYKFNPFAVIPNTGKPLLNKSKKMAYKIMNSFESKRGALYTPDFLMPTENDVSRIVWVDYLNTDMVQHIEDELSTASDIIYSINEDMNVDKFIIRGIKTKYSESSGFIRKDTHSNCIKWAQETLGIRLNCGYLGDPKECLSITPEEYDTLITNLNNERTLPTVIDSIQKRLLSVPTNTLYSFTQKKIRKSLGMNKRNSKQRNTKRQRRNSQQNNIP